MKLLVIIAFYILGISILCCIFFHFSKNIANLNSDIPNKDSTFVEQHLKYDSWSPDNIGLVTEQFIITNAYYQGRLIYGNTTSINRYGAETTISRERLVADEALRNIMYVDKQLKDTLEIMRNTALKGEIFKQHWSLIEPDTTTIR